MSAMVRCNQSKIGRLFYTKKYQYSLRNSPTISCTSYLLHVINTGYALSWESWIQGIFMDFASREITIVKEYLGNFLTRKTMNFKHCILQIVGLRYHLSLDFSEPERQQLKNHENWKSFLFLSFICSIISCKSSVSFLMLFIDPL